MASVISEPNGRKRILFVTSDGNQMSIRPGKMDLKSAQSIARHIEALLVSRETGEPLSPATSAWLKSIGDTLRAKLAHVGLIDATRKALLGDFLRTYILSRPDVKPATLEIWQQPCRNLTEFFGDDKPLRNITPGDAEQFKQWILTQTLAIATIAKRLGFARTFFHTARKHKQIDENPFADVKIPTADVTINQQFIGRDKIQKLLDIADPTWRSIIALARYGGLRCPNEVLSVEWSDIDWNRNRLTIRSHKTERYEGKATREIPLFPELRTFLMEAGDKRDPDQTHVIGGDHLAKANRPTGWKSCNLRTAFSRLIKRAGLKQWPRIFQNMRSSRETELLEQFAPHVVAKWMGHDVKVSMKHYAQTTDEHFERATRGTPSGSNTGSPMVQNAAQHAAAGSCTEL
ncbi:MAG: tyrosine-type recombinase/integrase [Gemmataceae bacterium]